MKNFILLISGLVITLLFLVFPASVFEALYYERESPTRCTTKISISAWPLLQLLWRGALREYIII